MTTAQVQAQLREIAAMADMPLDTVYRRFRSKGAPAPVAHPACVPVYDVAASLRFLGIDTAPDQPSSTPAHV